MAETDDLQGLYSTFGISPQAAPAQKPSTAPKKKAAGKKDDLAGLYDTFGIGNGAAPAPAELKPIAPAPAPSFMDRLKGATDSVLNLGNEYIAKPLHQANDFVDQVLNADVSGMSEPITGAPLAIPQAAARFGKGVLSMPVQALSAEMEPLKRAGTVAGYNAPITDAIPPMGLRALKALLYDPQAAEHDKALTDPNTIPAIGHEIAASVPVVGPMAASAGERMGSGDLLGGGVGALLTLLPFLHGAEVPKTAVPEEAPAPFLDSARTPQERMAPVVDQQLAGIERAKADIAQAQAARQAQAEGLRPAVPAEDLASLERQSKAAGLKESLKQAPAIDPNNPLPALADQAGAQAVQPRVGEEHPALDAQADAAPRPEPVTVYRGGKPGDPEARFYSESKDYADNYAGRNGRVLQSEKIAPKNALDLTRPADAAVVADAFEQAGLPRPSEEKLGDGVGLAAVPPEVEAILATKGHDWIHTGNDVEFGKETGRFWIKLKREVAAEHPSPSPNHEVIGIDADTNLPVLKRKGLEQGATTDVPRGTIGETSGEAQAKPNPSEHGVATQQNATSAQGGALQSKGETGKPVRESTFQSDGQEMYRYAGPDASGQVLISPKRLSLDDAAARIDAQEKSQTVGSASVVARDNELFQQAKKELGSKATDSQVAMRAQELKDKGSANEAASGGAVSVSSGEPVLPAGERAQSAQPPAQVGAPAWSKGKIEVVDDIYNAVRADLQAGKRVPIPGAYKTTWITSPESIRTIGNDIQVFNGKGWDTLDRGTLDHWAKVKGLVSPTEQSIAAATKPWQMTRAEHAERLIAKQGERGFGLDENRARIAADVKHRNEVRGALDKGYPVPPEVLADYPELKPKESAYGSQNKLVTEEKYQAAKKRFTDKATRMNAGLDPTALADLAEIGAYHLEAGARSFASWSAKMISELGEEVKPHLEKIWQQLNKDKAPEAKAVEPPKPPVVKTAAAVPGDVPEANRAGNINLDKLNTPEDVKAELQNVYRLNKDKIEAQRRGTVSNQQLKDLAAEVGTTPEKLGKLSKGTALNAEELLAARQTLVATGERLTSARDAWLKSRSDADLIELQASAAEHAAVQNAVSGVTAEAGRALQQFKLMAEARRLSKEGNFEKASAILRDALGDKWAERGAELAKKLAEIPSDDAIAINKFLRDAVKAKTPEMIYEAWINSLLSNPTTHAANLISNAIVRAVTPLERAVAGLGPGHYVKEAAYDVLGATKGIAEGVRAAVRSFKTETATADIGKIELRGKAIPGAAGKVVRTPGRLLTASDEFFKVINSTAYRHAEAYRIARTEGLKGEALGKRMSDLIQNPTPEMLKAERMEALYRTFQKPLGEFGQAAMRLRNKSTVAKVIAPFVQTPTNIAKYTLERTPLNLARVLTKAAKGELKGAEFSEQISRPLVGSAISAAVAYYVADGLITGSGPKDQNKRNALRATGWQPYSLKIGNKYYAYDRLEPVGSIVGMTADVAEAIRDRGENSTTGQDIGKIAFSISKNLTSKTFLSGVSKVLDAISDPERYGQNYVEQLTSSVIPSGVGGVARATDNVQRKPGSVLDALKAKTPGKSHEVLPVRDVFGAPVTDERSAFERLISPVRTSEDKNDPAAKELARLQSVGMDSVGGVSRKLTIRGKDVELSDEQRDHYAETRGKALRKEFEQLLAHPGYASLKDEQKVRLGERAKQRAYDIARMQLIRELSKSPAPPPQSRGFLEFLGVR